MVIKQKIPFLIFCLFLCANILFWNTSKAVQKNWANVSPAPSFAEAKAGGLSDPQLAYRLYGLMLQNIGSVGGITINLRDYDYTNLKEWFFIQDKLDERSNFTPFIASNYYGAVDDVEKLKHVLDYLKIVGQRPYGEKWRWLAHGVYLARYVVKDQDQALKLANILAQNKDPDIGIWAKQLPALILQSEGNTEEAYLVMMNILKDSIDSAHPNEINYMRDYICNIILADKTREEKPELCQ